MVIGVFIKDSVKLKHRRIDVPPSDKQQHKQASDDVVRTLLLSGEKNKTRNPRIAVITERNPKI